MYLNNNKIRNINAKSVANLAVEETETRNTHLTPNY